MIFLIFCLELFQIFSNETREREKKKEEKRNEELISYVHVRVIIYATDIKRVANNEKNGGEKYPP